MPTTSRSHKAEAKFNVTTEFPHLGLHSAAATGNIGLAKYALSHGQPINSVIDGVLPLHAACSGGNDMVVRLLIDNGADVNAPRLPRRYSDKARSPSAPIIGATGSTPLHFAAANGHTQVVLTLLRHGARPDRADKRGVTPEVLARDNGWLPCADAIRDWIVNKDRDLVERETLLGAIPLDEPEPTSHCREHHGSVCTCDGLECISTHVIRRLGVKHSIENAMLLFRSSGNDPQDNAVPIPDCTWPPPESSDSPPPNSDRRSSLPQSDDPPIPRRSRRRQHRPNSAGNGVEPHHPHSRRLGSKYSLLHLFRKPSSELLSSHSTPGGGTLSDVSMAAGTSNPTSSPTSPVPSSPSALALELNGSGQDPSPPFPPRFFLQVGHPLVHQALVVFPQCSFLPISTSLQQEPTSCILWLESRT
ncbi:ankyrin repeat-containing domain protein [Lactifluus volemus]|nr:ankyrin repeat-containing domain protein [Lactifluus volemus]